MAPSIVTISNSTGVLIALTPSLRPTPYTGSGTPWTSATTTPYEIANNDVTGDRWVLTVPPTLVVQDGNAPYSAVQRTVTRQYQNREVRIPVQFRANSDANLGVLFAQLRQIINASVLQTMTWLTVAHGGRTVNMVIESGMLQEDYRFWNDESNSFVVRAVLTLQCTIGHTDAGSSTQVNNYANGNTYLDTSAGRGSDVTRSIGQPLNISIDFGSDDNTRYFLMASVAGSATNTFSESLVTSFTGLGTVATSTITYALSVRTRRSTRYRALVHITNPNTHLDVAVRIRPQNTFSNALYEGPWIAVGTQTMLVDLGFFSIPQSAKFFLSQYNLQLRYRSRSGSATAGTLSRLILLEYYDFCTVNKQNYINGTALASEAYRVVSHAESAAVGAPLSEMAYEYVELADPPIGLMDIQGQLPRVYNDSQLWIAWIDAINGYASAQTCTLTYRAAQLYETINDGL